MVSSTKNYLVFIIAAFSFYWASICFEHLSTQIEYNYVPQHRIQAAYNLKYKQSHERLTAIATLLKLGKMQDVADIVMDTRNGISFYVYRNDSILYWSSNIYDVSPVISPNKPLYENLNNYLNFYTISYGEKVGNYKIFVSILVKSKLKEDSQKITKDMVGLGISPFLEVQELDSTDIPYQTCVRSVSENRPLFTLVASGKYAKNMYLLYVNWLMLFASLFFFILSYYFYPIEKNFQSNYLVHYICVTLLYYIVLFSFFRFNLTTVLQNNKLFSPMLFGSYLFFSLGELLVYTIFFIMSVSVFLTNVMPLKKGYFRTPYPYLIIIQIVTFVLFGFIFYILHDLIYNSVLPLKLKDLQTFSIYAAIAICIIIIWLVSFTFLRNGLVKEFINYYSIKLVLTSDLLCSLFINLLFAVTGHWDYVLLCTGLYFVLLLINLRYIYPKWQQNDFSTILIFFLLHNIAVFYIIYHSDVKHYCQLREVAQKVVKGERLGYDQLAEESLTNIDLSIAVDSTLIQYISQYPEINKQFINKYLSNYYFTNIWSTYTLSVDIKPYSELKKQYFSIPMEPINVLEQRPIHFYKKSKPISCSYLGLFDMVTSENDTIGLFINLSLKNNTAYEYLGLDVDGNMTPNISQSSYALYRNGKLSFQYGDYNYSHLDHACNLKWPKKFEQYKDNNYLHNVWLIDPNTRVVITEKCYPNWRVYLIYLTYVFSLLLLLIYGFNLLTKGTLLSTNQSTSIVYKIQRFFILFQMTVVLAIIVVSLNFVIHNTYENEENNIKETLHFVKLYIEKKYPEVSSENLDEATLLSIFEKINIRHNIIIHFYNVNGIRIATTHPYLFSKGIISNYINPKVNIGDSKNEIVLKESIGSVHYLAGYAVIYNNKKEVVGYLCIPHYQRLNSLKQELFHFSSVYINIYLLIIFLSALLFEFYNRWISKPLSEVRSKLKAIQLRGENEHIDYPIREHDEISALIQQYNILVDELADSAQKIAETEKEMAWREMAKQIAHEIKNPLTPMKLSLQQLRRMKRSEKFDDFFETSTLMLIEQIDNLTYIANTFSSFAKKAPTKLVPVNVIDKLITVLQLYRNNAEEVEIRYESSIINVNILGDSEQLIQLFNNILKNSIQAIPSNQKGIITVLAYVDDSYVYITITDNGCGMTADVKENLFKLNFTTKSMGMGIGLYLVYNYVKAMGGDITLESELGKGTSFYIVFPIMQ